MHSSVKRRPMPSTEASTFNVICRMSVKIRQDSIMTGTRFSLSQSHGLELRLVKLKREQKKSVTKVKNPRRQSSLWRGGIVESLLCFPVPGSFKLMPLD